MSALPKGASVALSPQLAPAVLERAVLPADRQKAMGTDQLALKASQRLALVSLLLLFCSCNVLFDTSLANISLFSAVCD